MVRILHCIFYYHHSAFFQSKLGRKKTESMRPPFQLCCFVIRSAENWTAREAAAIQWTYQDTASQVILVGQASRDIWEWKNESLWILFLSISIWLGEYWLKSNSRKWGVVQKKKSRARIDQGKKRLLSGVFLEKSLHVKAQRRLCKYISGG